MIYYCRHQCALCTSKPINLITLLAKVFTGLGFDDRFIINFVQILKKGKIIFEVDPRVDLIDKELISLSYGTFSFTPDREIPNDRHSIFDNVYTF